MAKQTFTQHLYVAERFNPISETTEPRYQLHGLDGLEFAGIYIGPVEVQVEVPESFDMRAAKLKAKQAELTKVRAEFTARITDLTRQINELQALEMTEAA
jgi:hypothetical protein